MNLTVLIKQRILRYITCNVFIFIQCIMVSFVLDKISYRTISENTNRLICLHAA